MGVAESPAGKPLIDFVNPFPESGAVLRPPFKHIMNVTRTIPVAAVTRRE
jgi:hypothetical protein